jgi:hypothetical protein
LDVPLDDAVEAEALAQLLDTNQDQLDIVRVAYPIRDIESLHTRLSADRGAAPSEGEPEVDEDQPAPRSQFSLLDRPLPTTGVGMALDAVPNVIARTYLYGRETDREARLELIAYRHDLGQAKGLLERIAGDAVAPPGSEEVVDSLPVTDHALSWHWQLPPDTPRELTL